MVVDQLGRSFKSLRISLLDSCNFACLYCTDDDLANHQNLKSKLSVSTLLKTVSNLNKILNLKAVRLTGGEPLLYPHLDEVILGLIEMGINNVKITSNGFLLAKKAKNLRQAGLKEINVSLDAIDHHIFNQITRRDKLNDVLNGIDAALNQGLSVKLNTVIMKGINENQIIPLLHYAKSKNIVIRFLEVMEMGHLHHQKENFLYTQNQILTQIAKYFNFDALPRHASATANYWKTTCGLSFGIIANSTTPFCGDCDRLRLDYNGNIYGCLSVNNPISLINSDSNLDYESKLQDALKQKQTLNFTGSNLSMMKIGG